MNFKELETIQSPIGLESIEVAITAKCNFSCDYCGAYGLNSQKQLSVEDVIRFVDSIPTLKRLKLSGGEVTLRLEDCIEVIKQCKSRGISTQLNTNGSLLSKSRIEKLVDAGLEHIHFSLNFISAQKWSLYYKRPERVFSTIIDNIRLCASYPELETVIESIIFEDTHKILSDLHSFVYELGVRKHEMQCGIPTAFSKWQTEMTPQKIVTAINTLIKNKPFDSHIYISCLSAYFDNAQEELRKISNDHEEKGVHFCKCIDGKKQVHIHSNGDIIVCDLGFPLYLGNAFRKENISASLTDPSPQLTQFHKEHHGDGRRCHQLYKDIISESGLSYQNAILNYFAHDLELDLKK